MRSRSQVWMRLVGTSIPSSPSIPKSKGTEGKGREAKGREGKKTCCETQLLNINNIVGRHLPQEWSGLLWREIHGNVSYQINRKVSSHFKCHFIHGVFKCTDFSASQRENQQSSYVE